jgi:hypothetical protein
MCRMMHQQIGYGARTMRMLVAISIILRLTLAVAVASEGKPTTNLNLRATPKILPDNVLSVLGPSDAVEVLEIGDSWYHVRVLSSGKAGWVHSRFITLDSPESSGGEAQAQVSTHSSHWSCPGLVETSSFGRRSPRCREQAEDPTRGSFVGGWWSWSGRVARPRS